MSLPSGVAEPVSSTRAIPIPIPNRCRSSPQNRRGARPPVPLTVSYRLSPSMYSLYSMYSLTM
jgi:hypothetical protein